MRDLRASESSSDRPGGEKPGRDRSSCVRPLTGRAGQGPNRNGSAPRDDGQETRVAMIVTVRSSFPSVSRTSLGVDALTEVDPD